MVIKFSFQMEVGDRTINKTERVLNEVETIHYLDCIESFLNELKFMYLPVDRVIGEKAVRSLLREDKKES